MNDKRLLFCDLDGVLLDSESDLSWLETSIRKTLSYFHIPITKENMQHLHFENIDQFRTISQNLGIDPEVLWPIRNRFYTMEKLQAMKDGVIQPFSDVSALYELKESCVLGIISNSPQVVVDHFVSGFCYSDLFSLNIGRGDTIWDIEHLKPDLFLFSKVQQQVDSKNILYIGDRESDKKFAENAQMTYFHLDRQQKQSQKYQTLHDIVEKVKEDIMR